MQIYHAHREPDSEPYLESSKKGEIGAASISGTTGDTIPCDSHQAVTEILFDFIPHQIYFLNDDVSVVIYSLEAGGPTGHSESHLKSHRYYQSKPFSKPEHYGGILDQGG